MSNLIIDGSIANASALTITGLTANSIQASTITPDIAYSLSRIREIIEAKVEEMRADEDSDYAEDDYEAGHSEGYSLGLTDGLLLALDTLEQKAPFFRKR